MKKQLVTLFGALLLACGLTAAELNWILETETPQNYSTPQTCRWLRSRDGTRPTELKSGPVSYVAVLDTAERLGDIKNHMLVWFCLPDGTGRPGPSQLYAVKTDAGQLAYNVEPHGGTENSHATYTTSPGKTVLAVVAQHQPGDDFADRKYYQLNYYLNGTLIHSQYYANDMTGLRAFVYPLGCIRASAAYDGALTMEEIRQVSHPDSSDFGNLRFLTEPGKVLARNFIVMPMGDSITFGTGTADGGYRGVLSRMSREQGLNLRSTGALSLNSDSLPAEMKMHTGMGGQRMLSYVGYAGFHEGLETWMEQAGYPDAVTVMLGTNDRMIRNSSGDMTPSNTKEHAECVFVRWQKLMKRMIAYRPQTWIIASPITPQNSSVTTEKNGIYIDELARLIKSLFTTTETELTVDGKSVRCVLGTLNANGKQIFGENARIRLASMYDTLPTADNQAFFYDRMHPNAAGYRRMGAVWMEALKQLMDPEKGGLNEPEAMIDAYQTAGAMDAVTAVFRHSQTGKAVEAADFTVTADGGDLAVKAAVLSTEPRLPADGLKTGACRRVALTLSRPLKHGEQVTVRRGSASFTFTAQGASAPERAGRDITKGFFLYKTYDVPNKADLTDNSRLQDAFATVDGFSALPPTLDRVGYYVTLARPDGKLRYVWVDMKTIGTDMTVLTRDRLGLYPSTASRVVSGLRVRSNVPGVDATTPDEEEQGTAQGMLQFFNAGIQQAAADTAIQKADSDVLPVKEQLKPSKPKYPFFDWNSSANGGNPPYGLMQIARLYPKGKPVTGQPGSMLFAYGHWRVAANPERRRDMYDEILLGDLGVHIKLEEYVRDVRALNGHGLHHWPTFNTKAYKVKRIEIWVRPSAPTAEKPWVCPLPKPNAADGTSVAYTSEAAELLVKLNGNRVPTSVTASKTGGSKKLSEKEISNALSLFGSSIAEATKNNGVDIRYDFGIASMRYSPADKKITLTAEVTSGDRPAALAEGAKIRLLSNGKVLDTKKASEMKDGKAEFVFSADAATAAKYTVEAFK